MVNCIQLLKLLMLQKVVVKGNSQLLNKIRLKGIKMKIKAKVKDDIVKVKAMVKHEMTTYNQAEKKTGNKDNANFITYLSAKVNGDTVFEISPSQFLSKNPIFKFQFKGHKSGDKLSMMWKDRSGKTGQGISKIK